MFFETYDLCWGGCSFGLRCVSWYKYLTVGLVFSHLGFWSGNLFLIAPFPDLCLLVPFYFNAIGLDEYKVRIEGPGIQINIVLIEGAKEKHQLDPGGPSNRQEAPAPTN